MIDVFVITNPFKVVDFGFVERTVRYRKVRIRLARLERALATAGRNLAFTLVRHDSDIPELRGLDYKLFPRTIDPNDYAIATFQRHHICLLRSAESVSSKAYD